MSSTDWNPDGVRCSRCKRDLIGSHADVAGSSRGAAITLRHLPVLACPEGHEMAPTSPDFGESVLEAIFADGGVPVAKRKGLVRKTSLCPRCDNEVGEPTADGRFDVTIRLRQPGRRYDVEFDVVDPATQSGDDPYVFLVELTSPSTTCPSCGLRISASGSGLTSPAREAIVRAVETHLSGGR